MRGLTRKAVVAALAAAAVFGGLAVPGTAFAGDKNASLRVCSRSTEPVRFFLVGENQYGDWVGSRFWDIPPKGCTSAKDYWWHAGRSVEFHHRKPSTGWRWEARIISANDVRDGGEYTIWIG
ncbi:hypothetical protein [Streptomyces caeruleatus]|uniref:Secreted protein n=1 Tax=Streptomyces caeruleatus TaxID=661399 RepID=A0A101TNM8_9ACTN|nr:hypothetical protein [Streptomyces caeruleatus]KUN95676.1 hypothetical protein AQJ67_34525 [Streptomyces caeruleatus]